jgi:hypothetical protein
MEQTAIKTVGANVTARGMWHLLVGALRGTLFHHHKGGVYRLLYVAHEATNARVPVRNLYAMPRPQEGLVVVYASLTDGEIYTRDLKEWNGETDRGYRRFENVAWAIPRPRKE